MAVTALARPAGIAQRLRAILDRARDDSLLRNSIYIMGTTVVTSLLGYVYWIIAARAYPAQDVGMASALISALTLASSLANLGLGSTLVQRLLRRSFGRAWSVTLNAALLITVLAALLVGLGVVAMLPRLSTQFGVLAHSAVYGGAFVLSVALWTGGMLLDSTFVAERRAGGMLARNGLFAALKIPLVLLPLLVFSGSPFAILLSWILGAAAATLATLPLIARLGRGHQLAVRGAGAQARSMLTSLVGHHFINVGGQSPMYLLSMLIAARLSPADSGYFYVTWMLGLPFFMVSDAVSGSLFAQGSTVPADVSRKVRSRSLIISALLAPAMLLSLAFGTKFLALFGAGYPAHGAALLKVLVLRAVPEAVRNVYVSVLRVRGRLRAGAVLNVGMALVVLALAWPLLPRLGLIGAGWAWLGAQLVSASTVGADVALARLRPSQSATPSPRGRPVAAALRSATPAQAEG